MRPRRTSPSVRGITAPQRNSKASHPSSAVKSSEYTQKVNSCFFSTLRALSVAEIRAQAGRRRGCFFNYRPCCNVRSFIFRRPFKTIEEIIQKKFVQTACQFEEVKLNQKRKKKKKETPALNPNKSHIHTHTQNWRTLGMPPKASKWMINKTNLVLPGNKGFHSGNFSPGDHFTEGTAGGTWGASPLSH